MTTDRIERMLGYRRLASRMRREIASLTEQYPNQWVAMAADGELLLGDSMEEILAAMAEKGISAENVVIEYLDADPAMMIL